MLLQSKAGYFHWSRKCFVACSLKACFANGLPVKRFSCLCFFVKSRTENCFLDLYLILIILMDTEGFFTPSVKDKEKSHITTFPEKRVIWKGLMCAMFWTVNLFFADTRHCVGHIHPGIISNALKNHISRDPDHFTQEGKLMGRHGVWLNADLRNQQISRCCLSQCTIIHKRSKSAKPGRSH